MQVLGWECGGAAWWGWEGAGSLPTSSGVSPAVLQVMSCWTETLEDILEVTVVIQTSVVLEHFRVRHQFFNWQLGEVCRLTCSIHLHLLVGSDGVVCCQLPPPAHPGWGRMMARPGALLDTCEALLAPPFLFMQSVGSCTQSNTDGTAFLCNVRRVRGVPGSRPPWSCITTRCYTHIFGIYIHECLSL